MDALPVDLWEEILLRCDVSSIGHFLCTCNAALSLSEPVWKSLCTREQLTSLNGDESWAATFRGSYSVRLLIGTAFCYGTSPPGGIKFDYDEQHNIVTGELAATMKQWPSKKALLLMDYGDTTRYVLFAVAGWPGCPFSRVERPLLMYPQLTDTAYPLLPLPFDRGRAEVFQNWLAGFDFVQKVKDVLGEEASCLTGPAVRLHKVEPAAEDE
eukprot:TRINITY_DN1767_c0_g3_i1.p1 TRINITY_DN1767_c0_g3~~TRINITY_DN1767_c0_g3_i1.p1  ORF type:complete len:238 (+),score=26.39 TRINITY_DN1767_c0_g3_i1:80-715(+)